MSILIPHLTKQQLKIDNKGKNDIIVITESKTDSTFPLN